MKREIKGIHVLMMFGAAFAVIIGVNVLLAVQAIRTFPGLEVKNSYVASQTFDRDRNAQQALGWTAKASIDDRILRLDLSAPLGPARARMTEIRLGRATYAADDLLLDMRYENGTWLADLPELGLGVWHLWISAEAEDGTPFRQRLDLWVSK